MQFDIFIRFVLVVYSHNRRIAPILRVSKYSKQNPYRFQPSIYTYRYCTSEQLRWYFAAAATLFRDNPFELLHLSSPVEPFIYTLSSPRAYAQTQLVPSGRPVGSNINCPCCFKKSILEHTRTCSDALVHSLLYKGQIQPSTCFKSKLESCGLPRAKYPKLLPKRQQHPRLEILYLYPP